MSTRARNWTIMVIVVVVVIIAATWYRMQPPGGLSEEFVLPENGEIEEVVYSPTRPDLLPVRLQPGDDSDAINRILDAIRNPTSQLPEAVRLRPAGCLVFYMSDGSIRQLKLGATGEAKGTVILDGSYNVSEPLLEIQRELEKQAMNSRVEDERGGAEPTGD